MRWKLWAFMEMVPEYIHLTSMLDNTTFKLSSVPQNQYDAEQNHPLTSPDKLIIYSVKVCPYADDSGRTFVGLGPLDHHCFVRFQYGYNLKRHEHNFPSRDAGSNGTW
jgi:hypothetical protein